MASATIGTQVRGVDAHDLGAGAGGIGERADDVEDGAHAEGAADRHDGLHGRVQGGGVQEGEAVAAQGGGPGGGGERDGDAEGFEDIGRAAQRGDGAVAVLGDCCPGGGGDQGGGGGDVEGSGVVSTGAAGVNEERALGVVEGDGDCCGEHGFGESGQLGGGLGRERSAMPQVSTRRARSAWSRGTGVAAARMALTKPAISAGASPRRASELSRAASSRERGLPGLSASVSPARSSSSRARASLRERVSRRSTMRFM